MDYITKNEIILNFQPTKNKNEILKILDINEVFEITLNQENDRLAFKAAWLLEHCLIENKTLRIQSKNEIIQCYLNTQNWSVLRSFSKIIYTILQDDIVSNESDKEQILNKSFDIIERSDCPIAVRCNIYDIFLNLSKYYNWLKNEIENIIHLDIEKHQSPAINGRAKKILKQLKRIS